MSKLENATLLEGDAKQKLQELDEGSVRTCVTSPPYWGLRDYEEEGQIGVEREVEEYVNSLCGVLDEVHRVLTDDGTLWLNIGDSYAGSGKGPGGNINQDQHHMEDKTGGLVPDGTKPKDLVGIPWEVAFELRSRGWYLRSDIIWCLSGGTSVYARTPDGHKSMKIKDLVRLDPSEVELWNGEKWTQVLGWNESERGENPIEIELRSGERIGCTKGHKWPTENRGVVKAEDLEVGDILSSAELPSPENPLDPSNVPDDVGWFLGLYLAEGSMQRGNKIRFALHEDETEIVDRIKNVAHSYGATMKVFGCEGKSAEVVVYSDIINSLVKDYIKGSDASTKGLKNKCWKRSDEFLESLLNGYLVGDGHYDEQNSRWRLGFTRNYRFEDDLRTLCARLDLTLTLNKTATEAFGETRKCFRGEIRFDRSGHRSEKNRNEIVDIRGSRARKFYDIGVEDEPHTFALASGVLTHNSKPDPMPESVKDRPTNQHEHIFLLAKSRQYYYDHEAIKEDSTYTDRRHGEGRFTYDGKRQGQNGTGNEAFATVTDYRNKRDVWEVTTAQISEAHFAVYPPDLIEPCVLAGSEEGDKILDPFSGAGTTGIVALKNNREYVGIDLNDDYHEIARRRIREHDEIPAQHEWW